MISWGQLAASAALGAFIGYFTNAVAIRSLFRPLQPRWYSLGWQGVIPRNRVKLANNIARVVGHDLLGRDYLTAQLEQPAVQEKLQRFIAGRLEQALNLSLAQVFSRLPERWQEEGLESWLRRGMEGLAAWEDGPEGSEIKKRLIDLLEQRLREVHLGELLSPGQADTLLARLREVLADKATHERLNRMLSEQLDQYLSADIPLEKIVPVELRELLHDTLREQAPAMLRQLAAWLATPENVDQMSRRILAALEVSAADEPGWAGLVGGIGLQLFGESLREAIEERFPRMACEYLHSPEISSRIEEQLIAALHRFLQRPLGEALGPHRKKLTERMGNMAAAWIANPEIQDRLGDFLRREYQQYADRPLDELLPQTCWPPLRAYLLAVMRLSNAPTASWSQSLAAWVRRQVRQSRTPLRQWAGIEAESAAALSAYLHKLVVETLRTEGPVLVERLNIAQLVHARVMGFELLKVEQVVKSIISDQLRHINLLGALLGGMVGLLLPFLNAYLRMAGL